MATSSIAYAAPSSTRSPNPAAVLAYLAAGHTTHEAARRFGVAERSIRRIRQRQIERANPVALQVFDRDQKSDYDDVVVLRRARIYAERPDETAGANTYWKCPVSGELMPVIPGTRRHQWEAERRAAHARHVASITNDNVMTSPSKFDNVRLAPSIVDNIHVAATDYVTPASEPPSEVPMGNSPVRSADTSPSAPGSATARGPDWTASVCAIAHSPDVRTPAQSSAPEQTAQPCDQAPRCEPPPETAHRRSFRDTPTLAQPVRVIRVPVEPAGLVGYFAERPGVRNMAIAVAVWLLLVAATWLG
jgi:hypothetical protein